MSKIINIKLKSVLFFLSCIAIVELTSFIAFLIPEIRNYIFGLVSLVVLGAGLFKLEYAFWILLVELIISSKGYLFYFDADGTMIPIRIMIWLIVMGIWFSGTLTSLMHKDFALKNIAFLRSRYLNYFLSLAILVILGFVNGQISGNDFSNVFFDVNAWFYFSLILPAYEIIVKDKNFNKLALVFFSSTLWISFKTYFLLYLFSHNFDILKPVYTWVRDTGVGEITQIQEGFFRIFFQSHIYALIAFFITLVMFVENQYEKNKEISTLYFLYDKYFIWLTVFLSVVIISFSRSFWLGFIGAGFALSLIYFFIYRYDIKFLLKILFSLTLSLIISVFLIVSIVRFPYPDAMGKYNAADLLADRVKQGNDSALSSRWALLPELWKEIKKSPIVGSGFGTTVTYVTNDPRIRESSATGEYTTYAFEWGWLDIWLKIGLLGILAYAILIMKVLKDGFTFIAHDKGNPIALGLLLGIISLILINITSPYFNHPLGIGYLMLTVIFYDITIHKLQRSSGEV